MEPIFYSYKYGEGIGLAYFKDDAQAVGSTVITKNLVYYKKGNSVWGTSYLNSVTDLSIGKVEVNLTIANSQLNITTHSYKKADFKVSMSSVTGQQVALPHEVLKVTPGEQTFSIPLTKIASGMYIVILQSEDAVVSRKLYYLN